MSYPYNFAKALFRCFCSSDEELHGIVASLASVYNNESESENFYNDFSHLKTYVSNLIDNYEDVPLSLEDIKTYMVENPRGMFNGVSDLDREKLDIFAKAAQSLLDAKTSPAPNLNHLDR